MSTIDSGDLDTTGYFLPEDGWLRLKNLHEYVGFLGNLARPRLADGQQEWFAEIRPGEVATWLKLLGEQIGQVLDELSSPAERGKKAAALGAGAEPEAVQAEVGEPKAGEPVPGGPGADYLFGITLDQVDEINLLHDMVRAHGDVVIASHDAEFANGTLSLVGHAIFCDAGKLRDIMIDVESQRLRPARGAQTGVSEERAAYHALPAPLPASGASHVMQSHPTCQ